MKPVKGRERMTDKEWLEWQRKVIKEEYVRGDGK